MSVTLDLLQPPVAAKPATVHDDYTPQAYIIMGRSERHADQYSSECLTMALRFLGAGSEYEVIERVLAMRLQGKTVRVTGRQTVASINYMEGA